jgi:hypothetical protein
MRLISAIIGSAVLYQEFRDVTFSQFVNFAFGVSYTGLNKTSSLTNVSRSALPS